MVSRAKRVTFRVSFDLPPHATVEHARAYLWDAVGTMKGCYKPAYADDDDPIGEPMSDMNEKTIRITQVRK